MHRLSDVNSVPCQLRDKFNKKQVREKDGAGNVVWAVSASGSGSPVKSPGGTRVAKMVLMVEQKKDRAKVGPRPHPARQPGARARHLARSCARRLKFTGGLNPPHGAPP
jgi:hypothetical protein